MKKKIILVTLCFITFASCGKKGDPKYETKKYISIFENLKYINS